MVVKRSLTYYLEHPEQVTELSEAEINNLVRQYPYAQSIKWLKARYDLDLGLPTMRESVLAAAAATDDLVFLRYQLLHDSSKVQKLKANLQKPQPQVNDEVPLDIERTPVTTAIEDEADTTLEEPLMDKEEETSEELKVLEDPSEKPEQQEKLEINPVPNIPQAQDDTRKTGADKEGTAKGALPAKGKTDDSLVLPTAEMKARQVDDLLNEYSSEISGFSKWLLAQENLEGVVPEEVPEPSKKSVKKKKKRKKKSKLEKLIDHSIVEREGVISETYADLLATQGYTQKAIELYQRLMLKFPEKSGYFAAKIEELQK